MDGLTDRQTDTGEGGNMECREWVTVKDRTAPGRILGQGRKDSVWEAVPQPLPLPRDKAVRTGTMEVGGAVGSRSAVPVLQHLATTWHRTGGLPSVRTS